MRNNLASLIPDLNYAIILLAPKFEARAKAPNDLAQLNVAQQSCSTLLVWEGASDATIYRDPKVNHAFRAWHDATHLRDLSRHGFTLEGERATCEAQCRELFALWPQAEPLARIVRAEIIGQAEHYAAFGCFPVDQAAFIEAQLSCAETEFDQWQRN